MTHLDCSAVERLVSGISLVQSCDSIQGGVRMLTPFQYPNGAHIDLFLRAREPLLDEVVLTDLGQTTSYLLDMQVKPWATNKRRQIIEDICRALDVRWNSGQIEIPFNMADLSQPDSSGSISGSMMRLAQACIRVSDLAFSARLWSTGSFKDEVEEFFESTQVRYEADVTELGRNGEQVKFDFRVFGETTVSLILSLSAASTVSAHNASNEVLSRWVNLGRKKTNQPQALQATQQRITILDESHDVFRDGDLRLLGTLSTVIAFPTEQEQLKQEVSL